MIVSSDNVPTGQVEMQHAVEFPARPFRSATAGALRIHCRKVTETVTLCAWNRRSGREGEGRVPVRNQSCLR